MAEPRVVTVTGVGNIGYALLFRIASGQPTRNVPAKLNLPEIPGCQGRRGHRHGADDCAFPTPPVEIFDDRAFQGTNVSVPGGCHAAPHGAPPAQGPTRASSAPRARPSTTALPMTCVSAVGNPANTNATIAQNAAPDVHPRFTAMMRLDDNSQRIAHRPAKISVSERRH